MRVNEEAINATNHFFLFLQFDNTKMQMCFADGRAADDRTRPRMTALRMTALMDGCLISRMVVLRITAVVRGSSLCG